MAVRGVCAYDTDQAIKNWLNNYDQEADDQPLGKVSYWHPQYKEELHMHGKALDDLRKIAQTKQVTLLYAAKDEQCNQAIVLRNVLNSTL